MGGGELARRRYAETQASAAVLGIEYDVNDQHCGELMPTLENRRIVIRAIRNFKPDLVLTHTPDDYHPDHRNTSLLVQDSAYLVTVPGNLALTPHLSTNPVYGYVCGTVTTSTMFRPEVVADITPVIQKKFDMLCCHESQWLEWIPYNQGRLADVPSDPAAQKTWMIDWWKVRLTPLADSLRDELVAVFGKVRGPKVLYSEAVAVCPFGARIDAAARKRLFPFLP
jgi:LmbE family N-acetylglucosaminyl deacetylase